MGKSKLHLRILRVIAWLLIGVVCGNALLDYLTIADANPICLEERLSEFEEDDRCDLVDFSDLWLASREPVPHDFTRHECAPPDWRVARSIFAVAFSQRGPPLT